MHIKVLRLRLSPQRFNFLFTDNLRLSESKREIFRRFHRKVVLYGFKGVIIRESDFNTYVMKRKNLLEKTVTESESFYNFFLDYFLKTNEKWI